MGRFEAFIRDDTERQAQDAEATLEAVAQVLTPRLRDKFAEEIINLAGRRVRVEMVRAGGQYGSPHYQVRLLAAPSVNVTGVLSEGEQTCVAVAAF